MIQCQAFGTACRARSLCKASSKPLRSNSTPALPKYRTSYRLKIRQTALRVTNAPLMLESPSFQVLGKIILNIGLYLINLFRLRVCHQRDMKKYGGATSSRNHFKLASSPAPGMFAGLSTPARENSLSIIYAVSKFSFTPFWGRLLPSKPLRRHRRRSPNSPSSKGPHNSAPTVRNE